MIYHDLPIKMGGISIAMLNYQRASSDTETTMVVTIGDD
jgi:hypothetical protein